MERSAKHANQELTARSHFSLSSEYYIVVENAFLVALIKTDIFITAAVTTAAALISPNVCHFYRCEVGK